MSKATIKGGATLWARQSVDSNIFMNKPHVWFKIWFYLVNRVNHNDTKQFKRGECFLNYEWIGDKTRATKSEIDHCVRWLKSAKMLATRKATRGMVVVVLKYEHYQRLDNYYGDIKSDSAGDLKAKQKRNKSDTINKNDKNDKNVKKIKLHCDQGREVNHILEIFSKINPTLNWGNKTTRKAASDLIKRFGLEETVRMTELVVAVQGQPYAPVATTPYQMKEKLAQFRIFFKRQEKKRPSVAVIPNENE